MKKTLLFLLIVCTSLVACRKSGYIIPADIPCLEQTSNPSGKTYATDSVVAFTCLDKHCSIFPLSTRNYWIYEDSIFQDGLFVEVRMDTLRFDARKSLADNLVWWESSDAFVGLPSTLYANDSSFFGLEPRLFAPGYMDVKNGYGLFPGDSTKYLSSFEDAAATCRSIKLTQDVPTHFGNLNGCIYYEKLARNYRRDQLYFKPGVGILKFIHEKAPMGSRVLKLQKISTLISYHIE